MQLDKSNTLATLKDFSNYVVKQSRTNLTKGGKNSSKKLYDSIGYDLNVSKNSLSLDFKMEDYGKFQDQGVSGKIRKFNTPFSYKDKMPPTRAFDKWIVKKGIAPRSKGKFISRESLKFAIARSVFLNGIKPSKFFTKPIEQGFQRLPDDVVQAYGLDVEYFLKQKFK
jgi:hypothetical protein